MDELTQLANALMALDDKLAACIPEATVIRDGKEALKVISRTGIADTFRFQTLSVVGSVSP